MYACWTNGKGEDSFTHINQLLRRGAGDVAVADSVGEDGDVVAELGTGAGGVGYADVGLGDGVGV